MRRIVPSSFLVLFLVSIAAGCGENADTPTEVFHCEGDDSCDNGLVCVGGACVQPTSLCDGEAPGTERNRIRYALASVPAGDDCVSETQTQVCQDGSWSSWSGDFAFETCVVDPSACLAEEVTSTCLCGGDLVSTGYCCGGVAQTTGCNAGVTNLRLDGGLVSGTSTYDGKEFEPLLPYLAMGEGYDSSGGLTDLIAINDTVYDQLYQLEVWIKNDSTFVFPVENGDYSVHLHFVDWHPSATSTAGDRVFEVDLEGQRVLTDFDIIAEVGEDTALVKSFDITVDDGSVTLQFTNDVFFAQISAIEILPLGLSHIPLEHTTDDCSDGLKNNGEAGVDCGGSCSNQDCCHNGFLDPNLGETDVDCGGSCAACAQAECGPTMPCGGGDQCCGGQCVSGACYYVSNAGSDSNDGTSESTPWQTIDRVSGYSPSPGDAILFRRGDTFRGTMAPTSSGTSADRILITAYETGSRPIITATEVVTGWTLSGGNIWTKTYGGTNDITELFINGKAQLVGRYPKHSDANKGFLRVDSFTSTSITDSALSGGTNWAGAEVVCVTYPWVFDMGRITSFSGSSISFDASKMSYAPHVNSGYFIQHDPRACTTQGEWSFNKATRVISLYSTADPNLDTVEVTAHAYVFDLEDADYYTFDNLHLRGASDALIYAHNSDFTTVQNCELADAMKGLYSYNSADVSLTNNYIHDLRGNAYFTKHLSVRATINDNIIEDIANVPGMGNSGVGQNSVINVAGDFFACNRNHIENVGYLGIGWRGMGAMVKHNTIINFCQELDDGSAIYTYNGDDNFSSTIQSEVMFNTIIDGKGSPEGSHQMEAAANGIYMDDGSNNVKIWNNTIHNVATYGIYLHNSDNCDIQNNVVHTASSLMRMYDDSLHARNCVGNTIERNQFLSVDPTHTIVSLQGNSAEQLTQNTFENNYYLYPYGMDYVVGIYIDNGVDPYHLEHLSLAQWRANYSHDLATKIHPITLTVESPTEYLPLEYNNTDTARNVVLGAQYVDVDNVPLVSPVSIAPYSSQIFFKTGP